VYGRPELEKARIVTFENFLLLMLGGVGGGVHDEVVFAMRPAVYDSERLHSVLGNLPPSVYERNMAAKKPIVVSEVT
jgi:hypothetical protein